ncbi:DMT family transporter [Actibacterium sp. MT2.3-13A]|uniref:DMT family transporter n=1 Tax=Actibacterium sp. MT2.3-13A TaxID=2828332 RepID=UPI001BAC5F6B|nr:DMT family transporter [Actibacterium sp. MT2.3-13A]
MRPDRPVPGIALMLLFCLLAPLADAMAKLIGDRIALLSLVTLRFAAQVALLLPIVWATGRGLRLPARGWRLSLIRTLLHIAGIALMFLALRHLPLAEAIAIAYVMPFLLLLLGRLVLDEEVGLRRLAACAVGFAGTLMVVQPNFAAVGAPALLPLAVAVVFALFMLVTRQLAPLADPIELQALNGLIALSLLLPAVALVTALDAAPALPAPSEGRLWALMAALGLLGTLAHLVMTWALRFAPSATLAPVQYLEIPFATLIGLAVFGDFPNALALAGIAVTMSAGLYIVLRERALSKAR